MMKRLSIGLVLALAACGGGSGENKSDPQVPPQGRAALEEWLAAGYYKQWTCEPAVHDARSPSPHGKNRICSNAKLSTHGAGEFPVDAASVKEIIDADGKTITGYAVGRKVAAGTTGAAWYWYERVALSSQAPHDANGVVADGLGNSGAGLSICTACHNGAGSDAMHSGHDMVYTQVK